MADRSTRRARISAILAIVISICAMVSEITYIILQARGNAPDESKYPSVWDEEYLKQLWKFQNSIAGAQILSILFFLITLGLIFHVIFTVKKLYRKDRTWYKNGLLISFGLALLLNGLQFLSFVGVAAGARSITSQDVPLSVLVSVTVAYDINASIGLFLSGMQILFISMGLFCCFMLAKHTIGEPKHRLTIRHGIFGLVAAVLGVIAFILGLLSQFQFGSRFKTGVGIGAVIFTVLFMYIFFPIWLIWLGVQLGHREIPDDGEERNLTLNEQL